MPSPSLDLKVPDASTCVTSARWSVRLSRHLSMYPRESVGQLGPYQWWVHPTKQTMKHLVVSNRPFVACHSRGTKPPCWDANVALGQDQQKAYIVLNGNFQTGISRVQGGSLETLSRDSCSKFFSFFTRFANSWQGNHNSVKQITAGP